MRGKGPDGMRTRDAIYRVINRLQRATGKDIFDGVKEIYNWGEHNIWRHIMAQTINLQPGYYEWVFIKQREKCLFLCEDGYFELYNPSKHGDFEEGIKV